MTCISMVPHAPNTASQEMMMWKDTMNVTVMEKSCALELTLIQTQTVPKNVIPATTDHVQTEGPVYPSAVITTAHVHLATRERIARRYLLM